VKEGSLGDTLGNAVGAAELGTNVMCAALGYIDGNNVGTVVDGEKDEESVGNNDGR
jgi:hypothetical protein